jgi:SAM-dependent methyltransferase
VRAPQDSDSRDAMAEGRWRGWANAEHYEQFVQEHDIYGWLNGQLVGRAELTGARRVLDLGCGTGATARAALAHLPFDGEVLGVDASPEMVQVAAATTVDPRARFLVCPAERVAKDVSGPFDRALSNAAFWQFPSPASVLEALGELLRPGGLFVFDVPSERRPGTEVSHPFQVALARAVERRLGRLYRSLATPFDADATAQLAASHGLEEIDRREEVHRGPQGQLVELMRIPAMAAPLLVDIGPDAYRDAVDEAAAAVDPEQQVATPWTFITYRRRS